MDLNSLEGSGRDDDSQHVTAHIEENAPHRRPKHSDVFAVHCGGAVTFRINRTEAVSPVFSASVYFKPDKVIDCKINECVILQKLQDFFGVKCDISIFRVHCGTIKF